jgi:hypothetical protein
MTKAAVRALPTELIFTICELGFDHNDYLSLSRFRFSHHVAQQLLYICFRGTYCYVKLFLQTSLSHASLVNHVQHVHFQNICYLSSKQRVRGSFHLFARKVPSYNLLPMVETFWLSQLRRGHGEGIRSTPPHMSPKFEAIRGMLRRLR